MRTLTRLSLHLSLLAIVAGPLLAACGDNNTTPGMIDAAGDDAPPDAGPDAGPDAMLPTFSGTITVLEASVLGATQLGQGIQIGASFFPNAESVPAVLDTNPGQPIGCKVFEYTPTQVANLGRNEGSVAITIDNPAGHGFDVNLPRCTFVPAKGYLCPDVGCTADPLPGCLTAAEGAVGGRIVGVDDPDSDDVAVCLANVFMLQDTDAPFTFATTDGRYVSFAPTGPTATGNPLFDGQTLPIVNRAAPSAIEFRHPSATTVCPDPFDLPDTATHTTLGGVGPIPSPSFAADPGLLANDSHVTITLTPGGDMDIPAFTADFATATGVGDDFTFTAALSPVFGNIPLDGSAFSVGCDATTGCGDDSATGSVLNIVTTDGAIAGLSPLTMPPPATKRVQIRCAQLLSTSLTLNVSAAVSAYLRQSVTGATRIQATFIRGNLSAYNDATTSINVVAGHAITTFKTVTQCNDGVDNDADGLVDFAADTVGASTAGSGCDALTDTSE